MNTKWLQLVSLLSLSVASAYALETGENSSTLPTEEALKIHQTGRGDDFNLVKAEGVTVQEFVDGAGKKLTNQQMIARHQHPSYDRLTGDSFKIANPTAYDLSVGDHLINRGMTNFTPQQFNATRYLMKTPVPTAEEIAATEYLMRANPAVIDTPNAPTKDQIEATCYLMNSKPCVIGSATAPTKNQLDTTMRLQDDPFNIDKPTAKEISVGDYLLSTGFKEFDPQQFAAAYYLINVLTPAKKKPTKEDIAATVAIQGAPVNKIAPSQKEIDIAKRLIANGTPSFTPQQFAVADYLVSKSSGIRALTTAQLDATIFLQTAQNGEATITAPDLSEINLVASGHSPDLKKALAWGLQNNFNQQNPETRLGGIARVIPTSDGAPDVHDFEIIWTAPGHQGFSFNVEGTGGTIRVRNENLPEGAFPNLKTNDLVFFTDITPDPDETSTALFKNGVQHR